jgi:hypothetical protein
MKSQIRCSDTGYYFRSLHQGLKLPRRMGPPRSMVNTSASDAGATKSLRCAITSGRIAVGTVTVRAPARDLGGVGTSPRPTRSMNCELTRIQLPSLGRPSHPAQAGFRSCSACARHRASSQMSGAAIAADHPVLGSGPANDPRVVDEDCRTGGVPSCPPSRHAPQHAHNHIGAKRFHSTGSQPLVKIGQRAKRTCRPTW